LTTEALIISGIQTAIQSLDEFASVDVRIGDWGILDEETAKAPYVILEQSDSFFSRQDTVTPTTKWDIVVNLLVSFDGWDKAKLALGTYRQALIDKFNTVGTSRAAGGLVGVTIDVIRSDGEIFAIFDAYLTPTELIEAEPVFLAQRLVFETSEF